MKRSTYSVVVTAVLALAYSVVGAQPPGRGAGVGPGQGGFGGPGAGRGTMTMLRGLDLTDQQREQVRALFQGQRDSREQHRAAGQLHRQLQAEVFAEVPDGQRLANLQGQLAQAQADRLAAQIAIGQQVAQVLTAEQRAAVRERLAQAPAGPRGPTAQRERGGRQAR